MLTATENIIPRETFYYITSSITANVEIQRNYAAV